MEEIAAANGDFKATFEKQQEIIADWIVSQKAFRELAYEFGEKLGLSEDEVRAQVKDKKKDVLNDTTKYGNNASSSINQFELSESTIQKQKEKAGM
jgi:Zn-dependent peptidase ImmA (M78 family)